MFFYCYSVFSSIDICYHIPSKQKSNEESSADLAYILTYKEFGKEGALDIKQMILDTEKHLPTIEDSKIVIDLDLIDLAYKDRYVLNGLKLREEYKQLSHVCIFISSRALGHLICMFFNKSGIFKQSP